MLTDIRLSIYVWDDKNNGFKFFNPFLLIFNYHLSTFSREL